MSYFKFYLNKYKLFTVISLLILFFTFQYTYINFIYKYFEIVNFFNQFDTQRYVLVLVLFIFVLFMLLFKRTSEFLFFINTLFTVFLVIPNFLLYAYIKSFRIEIVILIFIFMLLMFFLASVEINFRLNISKFSEKNFTIILFFTTVILLVPFISTFGIRFNKAVFNLEDIYEIRSLTKGKLPQYAFYFFSWLTKIFLPLLILISIKNKQYTYTGLGIVFLFYLFLVMAHKAVIFYILVLIFFSLIKNHARQAFFFTFFLVIVLICINIFTQKTDQILPLSLIARRAFFLPAQLNQFYFEAFENNHMYLSHSIFNRIINNPINSEPANYIATEYYNSPEGNANNGFISDGFMNFGIIGTLLFSLIIALIFNFFNNLKISSYYSGLFFLIVYTFISSFLMTSLFNHGILIIILISIFVLKNSKTLQYD